MREYDLYEPVRLWLERVLCQRFKRMNVNVIDSHNVKLSKLIAKLGVQKLFPQFNAWDVKIDVTGLVFDDKMGHLALVECKADQLTLMDVAQLLGYSIIVKPVLSVLLSPASPTDPLITLLKDYGRLDVLKYGPSNRYIRIAKWDKAKKEVIPASLLPPGSIL
ncbi:MAG: hypothetical protein JW749_11490 [Sedimentisphaerales bacterium]|nr:hypothetical protein [Sedimentisphaerales bacterium]